MVKDRCLKNIENLHPWDGILGFDGEKVSKENITYMHKQESDEGGRYNFDLKRSGFDFTINVDMPGCELERVRKSEPFYSPRLYVDGSSWLWGYALGFVDFDQVERERS